jgi:hypothetical protein
MNPGATAKTSFARTARRTTSVFLSALSTVSCLTLALLCSCGDINSSWEVKGGGYLKYTVNGNGPYSIDLAKNDVEPPFYVNNSHHYFYFCSQIKESKRGDQISLMVNNPQTGKDLTPVARANLSGRFQYVTWMREEFSPEAPLIEDSSTIRFDEIIGDSLWTAHFDLYFKDCRSGSCIDSLPPVHVNGRLRYWVPASER